MMQNTVQRHAIQYRYNLAKTCSRNYVAIQTMWWPDIKTTLLASDRLL